MPSAKPKSVRIRSYNVGFGDCFLLTFVYATKQKHVLIDFGSFPKPAGVSMVKIAEHIEQTCTGGDLAIVATHRHADHINGFGTAENGKGSGDVIRRIKPKLVVQPWTEHPDLATDAKAPKGFVAADRRTVKNLGEMARFQRAVLDRLAQAPAGLRGVRGRLRFLGEDAVKNLSAVKNLMAMGKQGKAEYLRFGSATGLSTHLPGVKVRVLGPPTIKQLPGIKSQTSEHQTEFWHILAATAGSHTAGGKPPFARKYSQRAIPGYAKWLVKHADTLARNQLLSISLAMDNALNNTSVILLFEVGGKKLLFPGDAQLENWSFALGKPTIQKLLEQVDVYKVGHHGSLNATPRVSLWNKFAKQGQGLVTMLSTGPNHHGDALVGTEVPRSKLVTALSAGSTLFSTNASPLTTESGAGFLEHIIPL